jgi:hypothetical protein
LNLGYYGGCAGGMTKSMIGNGNVKCRHLGYFATRN